MSPVIYKTVCTQSTGLDLASHYHHLHVAHNSTDINFKAWSYGVGQGGYTFLIKLHNDVSHKCAHVHDVYGLLKLGHQEELRIKRAVHRYLILRDVALFNVETSFP